MSVQVASIQKRLHQLKNARDLGLVMFGWVDHDINECEEIHEIKKLGLAGVIYDR